MDIIRQVERDASKLVGRTVFVSYEAGRRPSPQAILEARGSRETGICMHHYVGTFTSFRHARNGDPIITVFAFDRGTDGAFRTFNPNLGRLRVFAVL